MATNPVPATSGSKRPVDIFEAMRSEIDRVFDQFGNGSLRFPRMLSAFERDEVVPSIDVKDNGKQVVITAELPGIDEKDISVTIRDRMLSLKGEKKAEREEKNETHYLKERSFGSFERSLRLPESVDESKVAASFDKGVLTVTIEKRPEAVKSERKIEIRKS